MTKIELAYAAGIIDGEGYIGIKKTKAYGCQGRKTSGYHARIQVRMVDDAALKLLARLFYGHLYFEGNRTALASRRPLWCWSLSDASAEKALRSLRPYLRIIASVADAVLELRSLQSKGSEHRTKITGYREFQGFRGGVRKVPNLSFSDAYVERCDALYVSARKLNHAPGWAHLA